MLLKGMRILIVVDVFYTSITNYILNHIVGILENRGEVSILASEIKHDSHIGELAEYDLYGKTKSHNTSSTRNILVNIVKSLSMCIINRDNRINLISLISNRKIRVKYGYKFVIKAVSSLHVVNPKEFNVVHAHSLMKAYEYLYLKEVFGIPLVTTFHGLPTKNVQKLRKQCIEHVFKEGDVFFVNTEFAKKQIMQLGCQENKIRVIPQATRMKNFPRTDLARVPEGELRLMSLCRLSYDKGLTYLIDAVQMLQERYPYIIYKMVGSGPQKQELLEMIKAKKLQDKIIMCGHLEFKDVVEVFGDSHIFLLPSIKADDEDFHEETQAVVIQEAQSIGIPVIATNVGGIPNCNLHGETALLVEERNSVELCEAIIRLKETPELYEHLVTEGYRQVQEHYNMDVVSAKIAKEYLCLCDIRSSGHEAHQWLK